MMTYFPQMLSVPDGSCLNLLRQEQDSLKGPNPSTLLDPLCCTDAVGQARHCAGAQTHFPRQVPEPLWELRWRGSCSSTAGAHQTAQRVEGPVHGALTIAVISTHVTSWGTQRKKTHSIWCCWSRSLPWTRSLLFLSFSGSSAFTDNMPFWPLLRMVYSISLKPLIRNSKGWEKPCRHFVNPVCSHTCQDSFILTHFLKIYFLLT